MAAAGARAGHRARVHRGAGRAQGSRAQQGVQHRHRAEQRHRGRDRAGGRRGRPWLEAADHRRGRRGPAVLPGRLLALPRSHPGLRLRMVGQGRRGRADRGLPEVRPGQGRLQPGVHPAGLAAPPGRRRHRRRVAAAPPMKPLRTGEELHALVERLYPICRSITGDGTRQTLDTIGEHIALDRHEVPTGTQVLDWTIPLEWNIRDAYIASPDGRRVVDFQESNLHVVGYSVPVSERMPLAELRKHLHTLPDQPSWVPYRTSYYAPTWGFCLAQETLDALPDGEYDVVIDSTLAEGALSYGEHVVPGK